MEWAERRQLLILCHIATIEDFNTVECDILQQYNLPVLLSNFSGRPIDTNRYERAIKLCSEYENLYLVTSNVHLHSPLKRAINQNPHNILFGSDFPAEDAENWSRIEEMGISESPKALVLSENLRFLTERCLLERQRMLTEGSELLFPRPPLTQEELHEQGFRIIPPEDFKEDEDGWANQVWSEMEFECYLRDQPWRVLIAEIIGGLKANSVLEFGCNVGTNLQVIHKENTEIQLTGLDINAQAVMAGRERYGLDLKVGNEESLWKYPKQSFDAVFAVSVLDHIPKIDRTIDALLHCARKNLILLEVKLPAEGRVEVHYDHFEQKTRISTQASYSWNLASRLSKHPEVSRIETRPCYLHSSGLLPFYELTIAWLA